MHNCAISCGAEKTVKQLANLNLLYKYKDQLSAKAWKVTGLLGSFGEWEFAKKAIQIAISLGSGSPDDTNKIFGLLCKMSLLLHLSYAEKMMRTMRPHFDEIMWKQIDILWLIYLLFPFACLLSTQQNTLLNHYILS